MMKVSGDKMEIKRDYYLNKLIEAKNDGLIKVVTGIRRSGKSYLLNTLFYEYLLENGVKENHIIKIALDDSNAFRWIKWCEEIIKSVFLALHFLMGSNFYINHYKI